MHNDGVKFSLYTYTSSVDFNIETDSTQYTATYEHEEDVLPSGEHFEEFLRELRKQHDIAVNNGKNE